MLIRYLIVVLTTRCNLTCRYCYNAASSHGVDMSESVLAKGMALAGPSDEPLHIQLTGGEPTLVPDRIETACRNAQEMARQFARPLSMAIQTNATALTPQIISLFKRFNLQVGVSLDGPPKVQERLRGKAALTLKGLQLLEAAKVPFRVTTVMSRENVGTLDQLMWVLAGFSQAKGVGLDLLVRKGRAIAPHEDGIEKINIIQKDVPPTDHDALKLGMEAMLSALSEINHRRSMPLQLRELELVKNQMGRGKSRKAFCHACNGESVAIHPDGRLFPCGQTLGDPELQAGTVWQPEPEKLNIFSGETALLNRYGSPACRACPLENCCPGECPGRLHYNDQEARQLICTVYRSIWDIVKKMITH